MSGSDLYSSGFFHMSDSIVNKMGAIGTCMCVCAYMFFSADTEKLPPCEEEKCNYQMLSKTPLCSVLVL